MDEQNEKMKKLREEVNLLKKQLERISDELVESEEVEIDIEESEEVESEPFEEPVDEDDEDSDWDEDRYSSRRRPRPPRVRIFHDSDWGEELGSYVSGFVEDVMDGVTSELKQTVYWNGKPRRGRPAMLSDEEVKRTADLMSALGNEHRIKVLRELSWGGLYAGDLQETLKDISPSTLSSHLDVLQEVGLVVQEKKRGRYLISMKGRLAIKMASSIASQGERSRDFGEYD